MKKSQRPRSKVFAAALMFFAATSMSIPAMSRAADSSAPAGVSSNGGNSAAAAQSAPPAGLPDKILSGYTGYTLGKTSLQKKIRTTLDPMARAGFNTVDLKIHPGKLDLSTGSEQYKALKALADAIHQRDMTFFAYVYPYPNGERHSKKDADLPAFVGAKGKVVEKRFGLTAYRVWRKMLDNAFELAKVSRKMGIAALGLDLEHVHTRAASYDDHAWAGFAKTHLVSAELPASQRAEVLAHKGLKETYHHWYFNQLGLIARRLEREMHAINPDLSLRVMPARLDDPFYRPFIVNMGTKRALEIADNWMMYSGGGFTHQIVEAQKKYKQANPNLLFVPWFRINNYNPTSIPHQAYHAAMAADGYSNWVMTMLRPQGNRDRGKVYWLPGGATPEQYYDAYRQANEKVRQALDQGRTTGEGIAFKGVEPPPAGLYLSGVKVPDLQPAGSGEGEPHWLMLRDQQMIYIWAKEGEPVRVDLRHAAGKRRAMALKYALLDSQARKIAEGSVGPGKTKKLSHAAPRTGTYALAVTGGAGGGAWYRIRVHNKHMAVRMAQKAYLFRPDQEVWVARSQPRGKAAVMVNTRKNKERLRVVLNQQTAKEGDHIRLPLPPGRETDLLQLRKPHDLPAALYTQDFYISAEGAVQPFVFDGPERRLTKSEQAP